MLIIYAFGIQQVLSSMFTFGQHSLTLIGLIKDSWLPINFIMIPFLLISLKVGESENEIFKSMDISPKDIILSKLAVMLIIEGIILAANIVLVTVVGAICKASMGYFFYQSTGFIINTILTLVVCNFLGLFIGQVISKNFGDIIGYITVIILFLLLCNFYKLSNVILPLFNIRTFPGSFEVISYDTSYEYHIIFWLILSFTIFITPYVYKYRKIKRNRHFLFKISAIILALILCVGLGIKINSMKPNLYTIGARREFESGKNEFDTFFGNVDCGYYIDKYNMSLKFDNKLKNDCNMEIRINKNGIRSVELGLYEKLNITDIEVDGKKLNFNRNKNNFIAKLSREYNNGDILNMKVAYEGEINTIWLQGKKIFFQRNNVMFLADVFEWYPKLNDSSEKEYKLRIDYSGKNKLYSNLKENNKDGIYNFTGKDKEIFLISGNMTERKYKNFIFIGNEEYVKSNEQCDRVISDIKRENLTNVEKVIFSPIIPGGTKMEKYYDKDYLYSFD
ncbi:hypothetical protein [Candidatus Clostridium radicumherbarum]|uniref:ABC transporter permease n=1 Tax=Candidatus Clostridium radicumherbarum TaxID=3381662 RepID=A0ABW8TP41_9CLOT